MFEISSKKIDLGKQNICKKKNISLNKDLDCFIVINSNNEKFIDLTIRNILDFIIDKIGLQNTYRDFSIALEEINSFIKTWKYDNREKTKIDIFIGILNKNNFMFSNLGECSCFLIKEENEIIELISKKDIKDEFSFISNGELRENEIILITSNIILDYLSYSDIKDGLDNDRNLDNFNHNIENILRKEIIEDNVVVTSIKYNPINYSEIAYSNKENIILKNIGNFIKKVNKTKFVENLKNNYDKVKKSLINKYNSSPKKIKNFVILIGIFVSIFLMYNVLINVVTVSTLNNEKQVAKQDLEEAISYVQIASENVINTDIFDLNINKALEIVTTLEKKQLFLNDINKLTNDINILKKQFNKIEVFSDNTDKALYTGNLQDSIKIIKINEKPYIINKKGVIGPILPNVEAKTYMFNSLEANEYFVDGVELGNEIILLTNFSKVARFTSNGHFEYSDVINQKTWEKAKEIDSFGSNIYLLGKEKSQIFKHSKNGNKFTQSSGYLKDGDLTQIGEILSIAIDGGFYILKKDLSIIKFFSSPYRIEKILINNLPKNYNIEDSNAKIELKTRNDLNYIYLLMNNKIWVFKTNSNNYNDTKNINYIGQIEGNTQTINDFYINYDGEVLILNNSGIFKLNFEISDNKLIIR